mmetsp:Transcript_2332/g.8438  ORF Transcript_2332/g.8438 Transcript_2332/m.8438 type:complete len:250 (-) Transcript_2332:1013-1762(-)
MRERACVFVCVAAVVIFSMKQTKTKTGARRAPSSLLFWFTGPSLGDEGVPAGPNPDPPHGHPDELLDPLHVPPCIRGEFLPRPAPGNVLQPPWQRLVLHLAALQQIQVGGEPLYALPFARDVLRAHLDLAHLRQNVQLGDVQVSEPVHSAGVPESHNVQPSAPPWPARRGAVLAAKRPNLVPDLVVDLRWVGPRPDPRGVCLGHPNDVGHGVWRHPQPRANATDGGAAGRDEGVRPKVEVQHGGVGALD